MWDTYNEDSRTSRFRIWRIITISAFVIIGIIIFAVSSNQSVNLFMNMVEFAAVFNKPLFYWIVSGLVLSSIALVRINFRRSNSMTWFAIRLIINFLKRGDLDFSSSPSSTSTSFRSRFRSSSYSSPPPSSFSSSDRSKFPLRYQDFSLGKRSFIIWQITKILLFAPLFTNLIFGITVVYILGGHDIGLGSLPNIFLFPFEKIPSSGTFAQQQVVPLIPTLTLFIPSLLSAIGIRIFLYIGVQGGISIATKYMADASENRPRMLSYISIMERILGAALIWTGITMFFSFNINYNTKYAILGTLIMGAFFVFYSIIDERRSRIIVTPERRQIYTRLFTILVITIVTGSIMALNNSIADAKKIEWKGPYTAQEISVNRYLAGLDQVRVVNYNLQPPSSSLILPSSTASLPSSSSHSSLQPHSSSSSSPPKVPPPSAILSARKSVSGIVAQNNETLSNIRLWDQEAAQSKLRSWLGLENDVNLAATNTVRFNKTMYWAAATSPNLPADVTPENAWYNEHFVYTHSAKGVLMMQASTANVTDASSYFKQKNIYYGDSGPTGIFNQAWSAYPNGRATSDEIGGTFYTGTGGVNLSPPVSWIFEPNFMLSYTDSSMHVMRFKDIYDRMSAMYPYFVYNFAIGNSQSQLNIRNVGIVPVTDGHNTYWLMPLIVLLDTSHVPWSTGDMLELVGFALIDAYSGSVQIIRNDGGDTNNDVFSQIFFQQYSLDQNNNSNNGGGSVLSQVPAWLSKQLVYPEEMFSWKINRFNQYHITDPKTFIEGQQFYKVPDDASSFYTITKPPGFDKLQYVGFQTMGASNSPSENLVGYMVVQNDPGNFGKMIFYSIPSNSTTNLISASAARDILEKDPTYAKEQSLFRNPRVGDELLYRVGNQEVYFIPVYTSGAGGVTQIGTIAAVGASSATGKYYVGLGDIPQHAFENYLLKATGVIPINASSAVGVANRTTAAATTTAATTSTTIINKQEKEKQLQAGRILNLEKLFTDAGLIVLKPTIISAPVSFKEANVTFATNSQLDLAKNSINKFLKEFSIMGPAISPSKNVTNATSNTTAPRIFEWQTDNNKTVNFGLLKTVNGIVENHYISIRVG